MNAMPICTRGMPTRLQACDKHRAEEHDPQPNLRTSFDGPLTRGLECEPFQRAGARRPFGYLAKVMDVMHPETATRGSFGTDISPRQLLGHADGAPLLNANPGGKGFRIEYKERPMNIGPIVRQRPIINMLGFRKPVGRTHAGDTHTSSRVPPSQIAPRLVACESARDWNAAYESKLDEWMRP